MSADRVLVFENGLGRGLVFKRADGRCEVAYLRIKDRRLALDFLKRDGKLPDRIDVP